jgi:leader peptidase (prepilin peptidase)/N-methyltransferase
VGRRALGALIGLAIGWTWGLVMWVPLVPVGVALAVVDWRTRLLPSYVIRPTAAALVVLSLVGWAVTGDTATLVRALIGGLVALVFYFVCFFIYPRGLGFGDVRLAGTLGVALGWLGWGQWVVGLYSGFLLGGIIGGLLAVLKVVDRKGFPFGPFMLLGAVVGVLWGAAVWSSLVTG